MGTLFAFVRRYLVALGIIAVALIAFVMVWFQPHKLFIETEVDEAIPGGSTPPIEASTEASGEQDDGEEPASGPVTLLSGGFSRLEHETSGEALVIELEDGRRFLRLEDLDTSNGPDLRVYLSEIPASDDWFAYGERFVDLGALKGNRGNQNYAIPGDVDLARYKSAVIWCRRFTVGFGVAPLRPV